MITLALAGDTMLGRGVADRIRRTPHQPLIAPEVVAVAREADLFVLNLECCISDRGAPWPAPGKPFFFRAPPVAARLLADLGVDCVTVANNHALDFGADALLDTLEHLAAAGIASVGAGPDASRARRPVMLEAAGFQLAVIGLTDHPEDFAAGGNRPGVAFADLRHEMPAWVTETVAHARAAADAVLVTPHWGPNMTAEPIPPVRAAARALVDAGATVVAGHSAHVFHGVGHHGRVLFDLGDFLDDYAVDGRLRNDLGLLWLVSLDAGGPRRIEAVPLTLDFCHTGLARGDDAEWIGRRLRAACAPFGTTVSVDDGRLVIGLRD
ncbi:MAG TPA: CapA family protein [Candidatus Limnocylindria bacterium]|nr:CapA family protein [Candidatus Limnocylindria bacterium]